MRLPFLLFRRSRPRDLPNEKENQGNEEGDEASRGNGEVHEQAGRVIGHLKYIHF
jgi:hypothetical protein